MTQTFCPGCGGAVEIVGPCDPDDMDRLHCAACNDRYYTAQALAFPYGQCSRCGGEGFVYRCENGVEHRAMHHVEGACGQWSDLSSDREGGCSLCLSPVVARSEAAELPF